MSISQLDLVLLGGRAITSRLGSIESALRGVSLGLYSDTGTGGVPTIRPNLLENSSFEFYHRNDSKPQAWTVAGGVTIVPNATGADGTTSLQLPNGSSIQQQVAGGMIFPQGAFVLSIAVKTQYTGQSISLSVVHTPGVTLNTIHRLSTSGDLTESAEVPADGQWYRFFVQGILAGNATVTAIIGCTGGAGTIEIDAAKFEFEQGSQSHIDPTAYQGGDWGGAGTIRNFKADNIVAGTLTVGGSGSDAPEISVVDGSDAEIVTIGDRDGDTYGVHVKGQAGILVSGSGSVEVTGGGSVTVSGGGKVVVDADGAIIAGTEDAQRTELVAAGLRGFNTQNQEQVRLDSADGRLKVLGPGSVVVQGGGSLLAGVEGANRLEVKEQGIFVYDVNNVEKVSISTVDGIVRIDADAFIVDGTVQFDSLDVDGEVIVGQDLRVGANVLFVDQDQGNVGINRAPDPQFDLDVAGNFRAGGYIVGKHALQLKDATAIMHFDGHNKPGDWTGTADTHMGVSPQYHSARYEPGKFGKSALIHEQTTNLVPNPSFEVDASLWTITNAASWSRVSGGVFGDYAGRLTYAGSGDGYSGISLTLGSSAANCTFTVSFYVRATAPGTYNAAGYIILRAHNQQDISYSLTGVTNQWQRRSFTGTFNSNVTTTTLEFYLRTSGRTDVHFEYDGIQVEEKAYETPYCDGSLGNGHSWSGTPHASTSSRVEGNITWPSAGIINPTEGTVAFWFKNYYSTPYAANYQLTRLFEYGSYTANASVQWIAVWFDLRRSTINIGYHNGLMNGVSSSVVAPSGADWHHYALTWKGGEPLRFYIDGVKVIETSNNPIIAFSSLACATFHLTSNGNARGWYDDMVILKRKATDTEIKAIYESDAPVFAETANFGFRTANVLAWADSEGLWAIDKAGNAAFGVSGVDGKSWGNIGSNIDAGDVVIGNNTNYIWWDASAGTLKLRGEGSGITNINGGNIQTGTVGANQISATAIDGKTITGATLRTAASGARVQMDSTGFYTYNSSNQLQCYISTSTGGHLYAGNGRVRLSDSGVIIGAGLYSGYTYSGTDAVTWMSDVNYTTSIAAIQGYRTNYMNWLDIRSSAVPGLTYSEVEIIGDGTTGWARLFAQGANNGEKGQAGIETNGGTIYLRGGPVYVATRVEFGAMNGPQLYGDTTNWGVRTPNNFLVDGTLHVEGLGWMKGNVQVNGDIYIVGLGWMKNYLDQEVRRVSWPTFSAVFTSNWFRSTGQSGWYSDSYGGGWYMIDTTWVRVYNNKSIYTGGVIRGDAGLVGPRGGRSEDAFTLDVVNGGKSTWQQPSGNTWRLTSGDTFGGLMVIQEVGVYGQTAIVACGGGVAAILQTQGNLYSNSPNTGGKVCIYWQSGQGYLIQNNTGQTCTFSIALIRTRAQA